MDPAHIHEILMALKDAGASSAKVGPDYFEVTFAPEYPDAQPSISTLPVSLTAPPPGATRVEDRPGYASLFGRPPTFMPSDPE